MVSVRKIRGIMNGPQARVVRGSEVGSIAVACVLMVPVIETQCPQHRGPFISGRQKCPYRRFVFYCIGG